MRSLLFFALLFATLAGCKVHESASEDKFITEIQSGFDITGETNLTNKLHYPKWVIYYTAVDCADVEQRTLTDTQKRYEKAITQALKTWLHPLAELTDKKLIGNNPDDFAYEYYDGDLAFPENNWGSTMFKFASIPAIEKGQDSHVLEIAFVPERAGIYFMGRIASPCLGKDNSHKILLHELGHAFGLLDTYEANDWLTSGRQPSSIMSASYEHGEEQELVLTKDDVYGIQWLYRYYQKENLKKGIAPVRLNDCPFPDYEYLPTNRGGACRPRHFLMYSLKQAHLAEKHRRNSSIAADIISHATVKGGADLGGVLDLSINHQDETGNTSLHYLVLFGAWSLWNSLDTSHWLAILENTLNPEIIPCFQNTQTVCIELNMQNHNGDTALHHAARIGYVEAIKALLARKDLNARIKNKQGETACDITKKPLHNLQAAGLAEIAIEPTQAAEKIQAIRSAHTKILNLLTAHNACF